MLNTCYEIALGFADGSLVATGSGGAALRLGKAMADDVAELRGVVGLICAIQAWQAWWVDRHGYRRGLITGMHAALETAKSLANNAYSVAGAVASIEAAIRNLGQPF